jgi:hypothetical protein
MILTIESSIDSIGFPSEVRFISYGSMISSTEVPKEIKVFTLVSDDQFNEVYLDCIEVPIKNSLKNRKGDGLNESSKL